MLGPSCPYNTFKLFKAKASDIFSNESLNHDFFIPLKCICSSFRICLTLEQTSIFANSRTDWGNYVCSYAVND